MVLVELTETVAECIARAASQAEAKNIELSLSAASPVEGLCDPGLLDRLVWNLLDNAIKFTTEGGRVEVSLRSEEEDIVLEVSDTGPGIREDMRARIFERFQRADVSRSSTDGTGLGLAIVEAIVEAHGGRVTAENRSTGGARFRVWFPAPGTGA